MSTYDYERHLRQLAVTHGIDVYVDPTLPIHGAKAYPGPMAVLIPPVTGDVIYAEALHEFGHLVAPGGLQIRHSEPKTAEDWEDVLNSELVAWDWARLHAIEWTNGMEHVMQLAITSYLQSRTTVMYAELNGIGYTLQ